MYNCECSQDCCGHMPGPGYILQGTGTGKDCSIYFESLRIYIQMNLDGLKDAVLRMMDGGEVPVSVSMYENDLNRIDTRDDVLTTLIHLGYLAYDAARRTARIPNMEIRNNFLMTMSKGTNEDFLARIRTCDRVRTATLQMEEDKVAALIAQIHDHRPPAYYNEENALRYVILEAYNFSPDSPYITFEELSTGRGFCDILFLPFSGSTAPALIVELKWNKTAEEAIDQITRKNYVEHLRKMHFTGEILFAGISYQEKTRLHTCRIVKYQESM